MPYAPGTKIGHLTVIEKLPNIVTPSGGRKLIYLCECDCPEHNRVKVLATHLASGHTISCGCVSRKLASQRMTDMHFVHGKADHPLYNTLRKMIDRCYNPECKDYSNYGNRGISICREWYNPANSYDEECLRNFWNWSMTHGYEKGLSIDRINVNGNYEPSNCRWVNDIVQSNNVRTNHLINFNGQILTVAQLASVLGVDAHWFYNYLYNHNFNLSELFRVVNTPYGPVTTLCDWKGNAIPINCIYFLDQYGYPIPEPLYKGPALTPCLWQMDQRGYITGPII